MRTIILALLFLPFTAISQKQETFIKLNDAAGQLIKGDAVTKGFERSISVLSFAAAGKNNAQLTFSMNITGASADLKRAMNSGSLLPSGILTVIQSGTTGGAPLTVYTIKMENIRVNSCSESMGCNGVMTTTTVVSATRIGWTYYDTDKTGKSIVSRKYGYDNESGREWINF